MSFATEIADAWADPPAVYRGAPFWSWNGALEPGRLCRAIESMHEAGLGGFFMHSRYGLKTPYLSKEWFACVSACIEKARELGMKAYLYDEDRWPSGPAGGMITRENPDYGAHALLAVPLAEADAAKALAVFAAGFNDDGELTGYGLAPPGGFMSPDARAIAFNVVPDEPRAWHNDGAYLDTLNPDAVAEFIRVTHRAYADRYAKDFGGVIPAIFTDEPNIPTAGPDPKAGRLAIQWTADLPREFKRRRGYDIRDRLPELVYRQNAGEGFSRLRHDYYRTITELFVENFTRQIGQWCRKQPIAFTGHILGEENLITQMQAVGAAMPHYEHMEWPGIDLLTDQADDLAPAKQCAGVADQLGLPRVLSELYGCTGWDWPLEGHKFIGDWQYAAGINFRCPHLTHYTLAGGAKRDYPASIFSHSPWWKHYRTVEDYFGRLSVALTQGTPVRDVLVIHPIESAWGLHHPVAAEQSRALLTMQSDWQRIIRLLSGEHYDWDFGDESLLAKHAKASGANFKVGRMTYRVVVVPPVETLRGTTLALLTRFAAGGGKVLFVGEPPAHVDAQPRDDGRAFAQQQTLVAAPDQLLAALERLLPRRVSIVEDGHEFTQAWAMLRKVKGGQLLFLQSHDRRQAHRVTVSVAGGRPVVLWDPRTGRRVRVRSTVEDDRVRFEIDLPATGSALLTLGVSVPDAVHPPHPRKVVLREEVFGPLDIELDEPNALPLDYCTYSFDEQPFSAPMPTLRADAEIRKRFGLGSRLGGEQQPWYLYATGRVDTAVRGPCRMRRCFHVTDVPSRCLLALEQPENYRITVNGKPAGEADGWWIDEDIRTLDIAALLRRGDNEILLAFDYRPDMELEDMHLVGDFGVRTRTDAPPEPGNMTLIARPTSLQLGSWVSQGLDFYTGTVRYKIPVRKPEAGRRLRISLPGVSCTAAAIRVGERTFPLPWAPMEADITDALVGGLNSLSVEVIGGRKNILGPLHVPWGRWTGPGEFGPDHPLWAEPYCLTDHGLTAPVVLETLAE